MNVVRDCYLSQKFKKNWMHERARKALNSLASFTAKFDPDRFCAQVKNGCIQYKQRLYTHDTLHTLEGCRVSAAPNIDEDCLMICSKQHGSFICFAKVL